MIMGKASSSMEVFCQGELAKLDNIQGRRELHEFTKQARFIKNGKPLLSFACNDYLGLAEHYALKTAAIDAIRLYGVGGRSSRLISGNHVLYRSLEEKLANYHGKEAALVFSSGYMANIGIIPAIVNRHDLVVTDQLVHSCILDGVALSQAKLLRFTHNDIDHCHKLLMAQRNKFRHCLLVVESVYSMDGDVAPLLDFVELAHKHNAWILVDDAHGFGVQEKGLPGVDLHMGTLSKAVGSIGGYVCASQTVVDYLLNKSRSIIYTTALPPVVLAASIAAVDLIEQGFKRYIPQQLAALFCKTLGLPEPQSHIVPLIFSSNQAALQAQHILEAQGFFVVAIRPPTAATARLRFVFTALHQEEDVYNLCKILRGKILNC